MGAQGQGAAVLGVKLPLHQPRPEQAGGAHLRDRSGGDERRVAKSNKDVAFKPGDKYEELAKIKVSATPITAHPVITGNRVYVRDANSVALLTIE